MNKLSVRHLNFKTTRYRLENEDGTLLSSLENEEVFLDDKLIEFYKSVGFKVHEQKNEYKCYTWMVLDNR